MAGSRLFPWFVSLLLVLPLAGILVWLVTGWMSRSFGPDPAATIETANFAGPGFTYPAGLPIPGADFAAGRLYERVNGAADALIAAGCVRLLLWTFENPPAELELLVFTDDAGAARVLARDAGPERTAGPGDECSAGERSVFFRRGRLYARLLGEPGIAPDAMGLLDLARRIDRALEESIATAAGGGP